MKRSFLIIFILSVIFWGCKKKDESPSGSGTVTINNKTEFSDTYSTYYITGFTFSKAKKVSTLENPGPDITIYVNTDNPSDTLLYLQADNLNPSFSKIGDFADAGAASDAFDNLKTIGSLQWTDLAQPLAPNQVWVYKTGTPTYAKIRIISTVKEPREDKAFGECSFEWVYQPDGTTTFPAK
jgi:hypothetical protein